jgi:hypothetical protein
MLFFGHIGVGTQLARPFAGRQGHFRLNEFLWVSIGTLLPDLLDKSVFYANRAWAFAPELITSSRNFGHTALMLLFLGFTAWVARLRPLALLVLGMATHLVLDNLSDRLNGASPSSAYIALVFPLEGWRFADFPFDGFRDHLWAALTRPMTLGFEAFGLFLLGWEAWKQAYLGEVLGVMRHLRHEPKGRRRLRFLFELLRER